MSLLQKILQAVWGDTRYVFKSGDTMTGSLTFAGAAQVLGNPGSEALPSYANREDPTTGMYFPDLLAETEIGFSVNGVLRALITGSGGSGQVQANGTTRDFVAFSGLGFVQTGMFFPSGAEIAFSTEGMEVARFTGVDFTVGVPLLVPEGSVATPGLAVGALSTGLSNSGGDHLSFSVGGLLNFDLTPTDLLQALGVRFGVAAGADQRAGEATLVDGQRFVDNTTVTANTTVLLTRRIAVTPDLNVTYTVTPGVGFIITTDGPAGSDQSTFSYFLIEVVP